MMSATGKRGMTLLEICVVSGLVALLALVAWPNFRSHAKAVDEFSRQQIQMLNQTTRGGSR